MYTLDYDIYWLAVTTYKFAFLRQLQSLKQFGVTTLWLHKTSTFVAPAIYFFIM
jgi:hypothetical protein